MNRARIALSAVFAVALSAQTAAAVQCGPNLPAAAPSEIEALAAELFPVAPADGVVEPQPLAGSCTANDRAACRQSCCIEGGCDGFQVVFSQTQGVCICNCLGWCDGLASPPVR